MGKFVYLSVILGMTQTLEQSIAKVFVSFGIETNIAIWTMIFKCGGQKG